MKTGKAIIAVLAGTAAGVALGILFAPDKGSNSRKKIVKKSDDLVEAIEDKLNEKFGELLSAVTGKGAKHSQKTEQAINKEDVTR